MFCLISSLQSQKLLHSLVYLWLGGLVCLQLPHQVSLFLDRTTQVTSTPSRSSSCCCWHRHARLPVLSSCCFKVCLESQELLNCRLYLWFSSLVSLEFPDDVTLSSNSAVYITRAGGSGDWRRRRGLTTW